MGSTGSGHFSDYSQNTKASDNQGGESGEDKCLKAFSSRLEEVPNCAYFENNQNVPPSENEVTVSFNGNRICVIDVNSGYEIGYLPTKFNYLKACIDNGISYSGIITSSSIEPLPSVSVDISPDE